MNMNIDRRRAFEVTAAVLVTAGFLLVFGVVGVLVFFLLCGFARWGVRIARGEWEDRG